jgi:NADPH:quinone reductase-like Zn-dependent oxidoreductase
MRAIVQDSYGEAEVLHPADLPVPTPKDDEVLLRVDAAGIEMSVWHLMTGRPYLVRLVMGLRAPKQRIRGADVAGTVVSVGRSVTFLAVGDRVFGASNGSLAEFATAKASRLALAPTTLTPVGAASLPVAGCAALNAIESADVRSGQRVLVIGAGGSVGQFAVQLSKARGAHVTGVGGARALEFIRSLGADAVLDYRTDRIDASGTDFDVIIDTGGNRPLAELRRALTPRGVLVIVGAETEGRLAGGMSRILLAPLQGMFTKQRLIPLVSSESTAKLDALRELVDAGSLTPRIARVWPLDEAQAAVAELTARTQLGRIVVSIPC